MKKMYKYILLFILIMFGFIGEVRALGDCGANGKTAGKSGSGVYNCEIICNKQTNDGKQLKIFREFTNTVDQLYYVISYDGTQKYLETNINEKFKSMFSASFVSPDAKKLLESDKCPGGLNVYYNDGIGSAGNKFCVDNDGKWCLADTSKRFSKDEKIKFKNDSKKDEKKDTSNSKSITLCTYNEEFGDAYIYLDKKSSSSKEGVLKVKFSWNGSKSDKVYDINDGKVFISDDALEKLVNTKDKKDKDKVVCPKYVYQDIDYQDEICFDSDGESCKELGKGNHFEEDEKNETTPESSYTNEELSNFATTPYEFHENHNLNGDDVEELVKTKYGIENMMEICAYAKEDTKDPNVSQFFIVNNGIRNYYFSYHISDGNPDESKFIKLDLENGYNEIKYRPTCVDTKKIWHRYSTVSLDPNNPPEQISAWADNKSLVFYEDRNPYLMQWWHFIGSSLVYEDIGPIETCEDLLGVDLINEINSYMLYIKVAVPILIIVLGSIDFGKAFIASDEDAMKKAQKRFMMRIMIGMVIFFIPSIVKILLNIANQVWGVIGSDTCGIMF